MDNSEIFSRKLLKARTERAAFACLHHPQEAKAAFDLYSKLNLPLKEYFKTLTYAEKPTLPEQNQKKQRTGLLIGARGSFIEELQTAGLWSVCLELIPLSQTSRDFVSSFPAPANILQLTGSAEFLPFAENSFDTVIAPLSLHRLNDLPGALIQIRRALKPGGLFLASLPLYGTLQELREALRKAEFEISRKSSPRIEPFPTLYDCAALLQRTGFTECVAVAEETTLLYRKVEEGLNDLRFLAETNCLKEQNRCPPAKTLFKTAFAALPRQNDRFKITVNQALLAGYKPGLKNPA